MSKQVYATLIGDIVASRRAADRAGLQRSLRGALAVANDVFHPVQPLEPTVGDEFQGAFESPISAIRASLVLRLHLLKEGSADARFGLGFGEVRVLEDRAPISQDGPGWWSAREAIERVENLASKGRSEFVRTYLESSGSEHLPREEVAALNAFLLCRDALVAQMKPRSRRLLLGMILEKPQTELALEEKVSQSAVSQNLATSGAYAIEAAELELEEKLL
jgi:SatD family protein